MIGITLKDYDPTFQIHSILKRPQVGTFCLSGNASLDATQSTENAPGRDSASELQHNEWISIIDAQWEKKNARTWVWRIPRARNKYPIQDDDERALDLVFLERERGFESHCRLSEESLQPTYAHRSLERRWKNPLEIHRDFFPEGIDLTTRFDRGENISNRFLLPDDEISWENQYPMAAK